MHLAVIPDGAGRWAAKRNLPRVNGYLYGTRAITDIIDACDELRLACVSFYVSSAENKKRGAGASLALSSVYADYLENTLLPICKERGYRLFFVGDYQSLTPELMGTISKANAATINNRGMTLAFVFAYNGMDEITKAFNYVFAQKLVNADYTSTTIEEVEQYMYSASLPPVDALIRYGGYKRLSGYLPFRTTYAEMFFLDKLFPDADKGDVYDVMKQYKKIKRNFGNV